MKPQTPTTPPLRGTPPCQEGSFNSPPAKGEYAEGGRGLSPAKGEYAEGGRGLFPGQSHEGHAKPSS